MPFPTVFELDLSHGMCVGVRIPEGLDTLEPREIAELVPAEIRHAENLRRLRRVTWVAGRVAMRRAIELATGSAPERAILPDDRGAPILLPGLAGSISHKRTLAVAMVSDAAAGTLGVDIEERRPRVRDIARRVLTPEEMSRVESLAGDQRAVAVLLRFSLKEAVYKAIDPYFRRFIGFREVAVFPDDSGEAAVELRVTSERDLRIEARWAIHGDYFLTSARAIDEGSGPG